MISRRDRDINNSVLKLSTNASKDQRRWRVENGAIWRPWQKWSQPAHCSKARVHCKMHAKKIEKREASFLREFNSPLWWHPFKKSTDSSVVASFQSFLIETGPFIPPD